MNTDRSNKSGTHWWSFLDLHPKKIFFLFDSFGFECFKQFIMQDNRKILNKILPGIEKFKKNDNKFTLITLKFSMDAYNEIKNGHNLTTTTIDLLHLMSEYGKLHKIKDELRSIWLTINSKSSTLTCVGSFNFIFMLICLLRWRVAPSYKTKHL